VKERTVPPLDPWQYFDSHQIAVATQCPRSDIERNWPRLLEQLAHCGITDRPVQVAMIGTIAIESASTFRPVREAFFLGEPEPAETWRRNNLRYYPWYGRGFIQITWQSNYQVYSQKINDLWQAGGAIDLIARPDDALDPDVSAAHAALYFRDHTTLQGYSIPDAARANDWEWVRRLVQGGTDGLDRLISIANQLGTSGSQDRQATFDAVSARTGLAPAGPAIYNPLHPAHAQEESFDCSQESLEWSLWAWGRTTSDDWLESTMINEGVMSRGLGLMDASGAGLAAFVRRQFGELGYESNNSASVSFQDLAAEFAPGCPYPGLVGLRNWGGPSLGHWTGLRGYSPDRDVLLLANPADGFGGIHQEMSRLQFAARGPASLVRVMHPA